MLSCPCGSSLLAPQLPPPITPYSGCLFTSFYLLLSGPRFCAALAHTYTHRHPGGGINSLADIHPRSEPLTSPPPHAPPSSTLSTFILSAGRLGVKKVARPPSAAGGTARGAVVGGERGIPFSSSTPSVNLWRGAGGACLASRARLSRRSLAVYLPAIAVDIFTNRGSRDLGAIEARFLHGSLLFASMIARKSSCTKLSAIQSPGGVRWTWIMEIPGVYIARRFDVKAYGNFSVERS